ncbi:GDP-L-fucose synthase, partial [Candidatus Dependentiae bacterium]|nr:GDP-L-fucose synthase [Candidatus Dependentiae bacterium]
MNKDAKIYVAGHLGLVGSAIMRRLKTSGYTNIVVRTFEELDLRRQADVENFFAQEKPEYVILAAAKVGGILANSTYKAEFIYDNLMIAANVIHAAYKFGVKRLINLGSSCIYPKNAPQPLKEEYLLTSSLEETNEPYAIAKIAAIKLCRYYNEQYGTQFISLMPTNLYGPNDNFNLETSHVLPAIMRKLHLAKLLKQKRFDEIRTDLQRHSLGFGIQGDWQICSEEKIVQSLAHLGIAADQVLLWGSGQVFREFLFVDDLAEAILFFMQKVSCFSDELINVGTGRDTTIYEL